MPESNECSDSTVCMVVKMFDTIFVCEFWREKNAVSLFLLVEVQCPEVSYLMTLTSSYFHCSCLGGHFSPKLIAWPFRDNLWSVVVDEQDKCVLKHSLLFR